MDICLTGWSALECWRKLRDGGRTFLNLFMQSNHRILKASSAPSLSSARAWQIAKRFELATPLHIAVPSQPRRRSSPAYRTHSCLKKDEAKDAYLLEEGFVLAEPKDVYMQLAGENLSLPELAQLGYELSANYTLRSADKTIVPSTALIDPLKIKKHCQARNTAAKRRALSALSYVLPGSESPAESEMALKLLLPTSCGGFGLTGAVLNPVIALCPNNQKIAERNFCRADMLFESIKVDIEYDGVEWHTSADQRISDLKRYHALSNEGYLIINVDAAQLRSPDEMYRLACRIKRLKGERLRVRTHGFHENQAELYAYLSSSSMLTCPKA